MKTEKKRFIAYYGETLHIRNEQPTSREYLHRYQKLIYNFNDIREWFDSYNNIDQILLAADNRSFL